MDYSRGRYPPCWEPAPKLQTGQQRCTAHTHEILLLVEFKQLDLHVCSGLQTPSMQTLTETRPCLPTLQETKWKGSEPEALYQGLPGVKIAHTPAVAFNERVSTGGVAILFPPGWQMLEEVVLVKGRCIAALVQDRTCKFYVISVYIHPNNRSGDMEALLRAWRFLEKKSDYAFVAGDFNGIDKHHPQLWEKFLLQFQCSDVYPELATFRHARGVSCLDRGLVPDSLTNSSKLYASASVLVSHVANGHDIVKIRINVRPNVLNNPCHPKHEVIPSGVFMPGKDGTPISSTSELQSWGPFNIFNSFSL